MKYQNMLKIEFNRIVEVTDEGVHHYDEIEFSINEKGGVWKMQVYPTGIKMVPRDKDKTPREYFFPWNNIIMYKIIYKEDEKDD